MRINIKKLKKNKKYKIADIRIRTVKCVVCKKTAIARTRKTFKYRYNKWNELQSQRLIDKTEFLHAIHVTDSPGIAFQGEDMCSVYEKHVNNKEFYTNV